MLGGRNFREMIEKTFDDLYRDLSVKVDKNNNDRVHAIEAASCTRLAYYERRDPLPPDNASKISIMLSNGMRKAMSNARGEYKVDSLTLEANADMIVAGDIVIRFEVAHTLPQVPHPRHLLYINACLFAFDKTDGLLIYINAEGKTVEFAVTKNNRMFEEIVRRARVLSTLLKDSKVPIVEPSELCLSCKYYERCYAREKDKERAGSDILSELFGGIRRK